MEQVQSEHISDLDIRHFIYGSFAQTSHPPTTRQVAAHFDISIANVEEALSRLADTHHIALAPGSFSIWMAHPFSAIPTNFTAEVDGKKYWGN